jgi:hypothetical protein
MFLNNINDSYCKNLSLSNSLHQRVDSRKFSRIDSISVSDI